METITTILLIAIGIFAIGNILLFFLEKKVQKKLPLTNATAQVISSKLDVLNKRVNRLEQEEHITKEKIIVKERDYDEIKENTNSKKKTDCSKITKKKSETLYPITRYKKKK